MPFQKLQLKPGIDREATRYAREGGYYECDKIRFRHGYPEQIGGWTRISANTFDGTCRALWSWNSLDNIRYTSVGTSEKFYVEDGGQYYNITPVRETRTLGTDPIATTLSSTTVTITDTGNGYTDGDWVTFSGATAVGGITISGEYKISYTSGTTYTIEHGVAASSTDTGGGASVSAEYQINVGPSVAQPYAGWSAGEWSFGTWGFGGTSIESLRLWSQANFGEDLVFAPRGGELYYWDASVGTGTKAVLASSLGGAANVPTYANHVLVSDISRFTFVFGTNYEGTSTVDPMHLRWSDQDTVVEWTTTATTQAGGLQLSRGSELVTALQSRQEILVWSDTALYSLQYVGPPIVWGSQLLGDNISIASSRAAATAGGAVYWMGVDRFYAYDGRIRPLHSKLRRFVFDDIDALQYPQVFAGTNEAYDEVWWFYCSNGSDTVDKYVIYNYVEDLWYYGSMARTAWVDSGLRPYPTAATYTYNLVEHENGIDDDETATTAAINSHILTADFDIEDGDRFMFVDKVLPDFSFEGSTTGSPAVTMTFYPLDDSGAGYTSPLSTGGNSTGTVTRSVSSPVEEYTSQLNVRLRGRQMAIKVENSTIGVQWQMGALRLRMRPDGRRG